MLRKAPAGSPLLWRNEIGCTVSIHIARKSRFPFRLPRRRSCIQPGPRHSRQAFYAKIRLHVPGVDNVGSPGPLFLSAERARIMKPRDVIHHENAHALDAGCNGLGDIALPVYVIPIVLRERLQEKPVFSTIVSSERVIAVRAGGKAHSCNLRNGFGSVVVPLIKVRHIRAHLFHSLDHHAIDFADVRAEDEVLFDPASQIRRNSRNECRRVRL